MRILVNGKKVERTQKEFVKAAREHKRRGQSPSLE